MSAKTVQIYATSLVDLLAIGSSMITLVQQIKAQTQQNAPDVWASVSSDYAAVVSQWNVATGGTTESPPIASTLETTAQTGTTDAQATAATVDAGANPPSESQSTATAAPSPDTRPPRPNSVVRG